MSKVDQLRAMREARWAARQQTVSAPRSLIAPVPHAPAASAPSTASTASSHVVGFAPPPVQPVTPAAAASAGGNRPNLTAGKPIGSYRDDDLRELVVWLTGQGRAASLDQAVDEVMAELGFQRRGKVIRLRVQSAWTHVHGQ